MKKIGVLTFHKTFNAGAFLQAFAVQEIFAAAGFDVEVINYAPFRGMVKEYKSRVVSKSPLHSALSIYKSRSIERRFLRLSPSWCVSDDYVSAKKMLDGYDAIVVGSDTVFENRPAGKGYAPSVPNIYFAPPDLSINKYSFAASSDKSDMGIITPAQEQYISDSLQNFSMVSVRDQVTADFVQKFSGRNASLVFDPTLSLGLETFQVDDSRRIEKKYALLNLSDLRLSRLVSDDFRRRGFLVVSPIRNRFADLNLLGRVDHFQWANLCEHAEIVVTDRFHGTIFSLKHGCPVLAVDDAAEYANVLSKKQDMLNRLNLEELLFTNKEVMKADAEMVSGKISELFSGWDLDRVNTGLAHAKSVNDGFVNQIVEKEMG